MVYSVLCILYYSLLPSCQFCIIISRPGDATVNLSPQAQTDEVLVEKILREKVKYNNIL